MDRGLLERAIALHGEGRLAEAEAVYREILAADPRSADARHMLGVLKAQQGLYDEAHDLIAPMVADNPGDALARENLGNVLRALGRRADALRNFDAALALAPGKAALWGNRANTLQDMGRLEEALADYDRALSLQPDFLTLTNRGNLLLAMKRIEAALDSYEQALALNPGYAEAHANRADALQRLCRYDEAVAGYDRALALDPGDAGVWSTRGVAAQDLGRLDEARENFLRAGKLAPGMPDARLNQGLLYLLREDFAKGWPLFEVRKEIPDLGESRSFDQPLWTGAEDIAGKTLFIYIRRGLGDAIQFYRYAALAQARGARVVFSVNDPLLPLLASATPQVPMIGGEQVPESFDYHIPMMSMPLALGGAIPATGRYLAAEATRVAQWRERIGARGYRVAVAWQGDAVVLGAEGKAFPLAALASIAAIPGVRLISLQKNAGAEQLGQLPAGMVVEDFPGLDEGPGAFLDSAAIMENCDLVISSDTAVAHLAGALGVRCWIALKYVPEWRWFLDRSDTPWYPSARLFRQSAPGDWGGVFRAMEVELGAILSER